mgnify:CR=1 FL=1|jgi:hypothetical protein
MIRVSECSLESKRDKVWLVISFLAMILSMVTLKSPRITTILLVVAMGFLFLFLIDIEFWLDVNEKSYRVTNVDFSDLLFLKSVLKGKENWEDIIITKEGVFYVKNNTWRSLKDFLNENNIKMLERLENFKC